VKNKIAVTAVSDVKSTDTILNYMKKTIPKLNFDKESYKDFFEEVEVDARTQVYKDTISRTLGKKIKEEVEMDEAKTPMYPPTIKNLRMIVKDKQNQVFMFKVGKARVDTFTASAIVAVYDGLKKSEHKKKLEDMIKTKEGFLKTQSFAMKMVK
jgi:phage terminase large subunit-like protein